MKNVILEMFLEKCVKLGYVEMSEGQLRKGKRIKRHKRKKVQNELGNR